MLERDKCSWQAYVIPFLIFFIWCALSVTGRLNAGVFPTVSEVWDAFLYLTSQGLLLKHILDSLFRVIVGFGMAIAVGVPLGILMGWIPKSQIWFGPFLHFLRQIPPTAWIPLFLLWLGIGEGSKLAVIFYASVFPIAINTALGVQQIPNEYWEVSRALCLPAGKTLTKLILPGSLQAIFTGLRLGMGMSWRALVAAEMLASSSGLGYLIMSSRSLVRVDEMLVGIACIGFIGMFIDILFVTVQKRMLPMWQFKSSTVRGEVYGEASPAVRKRLQEVQ